MWPCLPSPENCQLFPHLASLRVRGPSACLAHIPPWSGPPPHLVEGLTAWPVDPCTAEFKVGTWAPQGSASSRALPMCVLSRDAQEPSSLHILPDAGSRRAPSPGHRVLTVAGGTVGIYWVSPWCCFCFEPFTSRGREKWWGMGSLRGAERVRRAAGGTEWKAAHRRWQGSSCTMASTLWLFLLSLPGWLQFCYISEEFGFWLEMSLVTFIFFFNKNACI